MIRLIERLIYPLFFVTAIFGLAYWYWTTTPTYALSQIVSAVKNSDIETFEKYVDLESISYRAIDDLLHGPATESGMFGKFDGMIGVGIIGLFKPEISDIAKFQVLKFIESGQLKNALATESQKDSPSSNPSKSSLTKTSHLQIVTGQSPASSLESSNRTNSPGLTDNSAVSRYARDLKLSTQLKAYGLSKQGFKGIDYLKIEGQTALVGFKFHSEKFARNIIIEIKMEDTGGCWRVTELSNLNALITIYLETRDKLDTSHALQAQILSANRHLPH